MSLTLGSLAPFINIGTLQNAEMRLVVMGYNLPDPDWLRRTNFTLDGATRVADNVYDLTVPRNGEVGLKVSLTPPRTRGRKGDDNNFGRQRFAPAESGAGEAAPGAQSQQVVSALTNLLGEALRKKYGNRPVVFFQGLVRIGTMTVAGVPGGKVTLYQPTGYTAYVIDDKAGGAKCGKSTASSFVFSASFVFFGFVLIWRRARRRPGKKGKVERDD